VPEAQRLKPLRRLSKNKLFISFLKNVVRQHNDLIAPAALEQKQTLYFFFKKRCASAQRLNSPCGA